MRAYQEPEPAVPLRVPHLIALQRSAGNQAVVRLLRAQAPVSEPADAEVLDIEGRAALVPKR